MKINLIEDVAEDWNVVITDHMHSSESRDIVKIESIREDGLTLRPRRPWSSQGRSFPVSSLSWEGLEIEGLVAQRYTVATGTTSRTTEGVRYVSRTYTFQPPAAWLNERKTR